MKYLWCLYLVLGGNLLLQAQVFKPNSLSVAYFGETLTHPGLKLGLNFQLHSWEKAKIKGNGVEKRLQKSFNLQPSLGFYHHQDYQKGLFILPELGYTRKNGKGAFTTFGAGAGYLHTFVPRVYVLEQDGAIKQISAGYNYFVSNYFVTLGKDLSVRGGLPLAIFCQPQLMNAVPNAQHGIWYFSLEMGLKLKM